MVSLRRAVVRGLGRDICPGLGGPSQVPFPGVSKKCACSLQTITPRCGPGRVLPRRDRQACPPATCCVLDDSVEMEVGLASRFFGGWKTHYIVGYNLPSYEYLYNLGQSQ